MNRVNIVGHADRQELALAWGKFVEHLGLEDLTDWQVEVLVAQGLIPPAASDEDRVARLILGAIARDQGGPCSRSALRRGLSSVNRRHFDKAIELLVKEGRVTPVAVARGVQYTSSIDLWAMQQA